MRRRQCQRHRGGQPCSCAMGNLYRFIEPVVLYLLRKGGRTHGYDLAKGMQEHALTDSAVETGALYRTLRRLEENGYVESFNGKLRDELLNREIFTTLTEAKILIEQWRREYNHIRPHSSLGYRPPAPEAVMVPTLT